MYEPLCGSYAYRRISVFTFKTKYILSLKNIFITLNHLLALSNAENTTNANSVSYFKNYKYCNTNIK